MRFSGIRYLRWTASSTDRIEPERSFARICRSLWLALIAIDKAPEFSKFSSIPVSAVVAVPRVAAVPVVANDIACRGASDSEGEEVVTAVFGWLEQIQSHLVVESLSNHSGIRSARNRRYSYWKGIA